MNTRWIGSAIAGLLLLMSFACSPLFAHHGGAAYDRANTLSVKATVTDFRFINPHVQIYFDAADASGTVSHWSGEFPWDPGMLSRYGWDRNTVKAGDHITVVGHPAKSGAKVMSVSKVILASGQELSTSPPAQ